MTNKMLLNELKNNIKSCEHIIDDLKTFSRVFDTDYDEDQILNILIGLETLYTHKFNELNQAFEKLNSRLL
jgi:hypothetical protein